MWNRRQRMAAYDIPRLDGGLLIPHRGRDIFVSANAGSTRFSGGSDQDTGRDWDHALLTMATALDMAETHDRIYFVGDVREEIDITDIDDLNLKFDIWIVGAGSLHHADQPDSTTNYDPGAAIWRAPASPTAATELLEVYGRGWNFRNILFDCPVDAAAVKLNSNASSGTAEHDASHASFIGCQFSAGLRGIQDTGGVINVLVEDCVFRGLSEAGGCAIENTSTSVRVPQFWRIRNNHFAGNGQSGGNESHIDAPLSSSLIEGNFFGTVEGTDLYIDLTGGDDNIVAYNVLAGAYNTSDYVAGTNDIWYQNACAVTVTTAPDGVSILVPAAP